jgi:hypothetical protein
LHGPACEPARYGTRHEGNEDLRDAESEGFFGLQKCAAAQMKESAMSVSSRLNNAVGAQRPKDSVRIELYAGHTNSGAAVAAAAVAILQRGYGVPSDRITISICKKSMTRQVLVIAESSGD